MSYNDKKFGFTLPVRTGTPTGAANERQMLDRLGGSAGYRKSFVTGPDGSVTMCTTKNGMPQFTTVHSTAQITDHVVYLESGQLTWSYPAPESPWRLDPAVWRFMDIPTSSSFLGYSDKTGTQKGAVSEGQDSEAVGYPKAVVSGSITPAQAAVLDAQARAEYEELVLLRKQVTGIYPPSLYSGKMRLFIQAKYGARTGDMPYPFELQLTEGLPPVLFLTTGGRLEIGFDAYKSLGIYTAPDHTYWLLNVSMSSGNVFVTYYPIYHDARVSDFVAELKVSPSDELEAYVFAYSTVDLARPTTIVCAGAIGDPMAYGWKFNTDGSRASIIVHATTGSTTTLRWSARTVHLDFAYNSRTISVSSTVSAPQEWVDGWGTFNFFVPYDALSSSPLVHYSLLASTMASRFNYSDVPIYGYYKNDVWVEAKVSATALTGPFPMYSYSESGVTHAPGYVVDPYTGGQYNSGVMPASGSCSARYSTIGSGDTAKVDVGGHATSGYYHSGTHSFHYKSCSPGGTSGANYVGFNSNTVGSCAFTPATVIGTSGWAGDGSDYVSGASVATNNTSWVGSYASAWTFIIPCGDCEAVVVTTHELSSAPSGYSTGWSIDGGVYQFSGNGYSFTPWTGCGSSNNSFYGTWGAPASSGTNTDGPATASTDVNCFSSSITSDAGAPGVPGGSYETLFVVDRDYPYYARGIQTYSSYGKRYRGSDIEPSPPSVADGVFVGWA